MKKLEDFLGSQGLTGEEPEEIIDSALESMRNYLRMDIAFLSEFVDDNMVLRAVRAPGLEKIAFPGASYPLDYVYCKRVVDGLLPELVADTSQNPVTAQLPITRDIPIGSHLSIPIHRSDGTIYGTFCCLSAQANTSLNARDVEMMQIFARLSAQQVNDNLEAATRRAEIGTRLQRIMEDGGFRMIYQPIVELEKNALAGFESLCRFESTPYRPPNVWFDEADKIGMKVELELRAIETALEAFDSLPEHLYLSVNTSPDALASGRLSEVFKGYPRERILLELTEHMIVKNYEAVIEQLDKLRYEGIQLAIDDAGAGYSGLQHIIRLRPDVIKLDMSLTSGIDQNRAKRSLTAALVHFASETSATLIAEGIETEAERATLQELGVSKGQGYLLGRPAPLAESLATWQAASRPESDVG